jgi:dimethylaniline monooxygenase (N-oxide forming)
MKVCVIGAGPSGLTTIKQLLDEGHDVTCFEKNENIGGIWYRHQNDRDEMKVYDNLLLTISAKLMSFSDFMDERDRVFFTREQYLAYLESYADTFRLRERVRFNTSVTAVQRRKDGLWCVATMSHGARVDHVFDAVAVCSGPFQIPNMDVANLDQFTGDVVHSSAYRNADRFRDKKVLVVGLAESGADLLRQISDVASSCTLSIRSYSFLLPRLFCGKYSTDALSARSHHYEAFVRAANIPFGARAIFGESAASRVVFSASTKLYGVATVVARALSKVVALIRSKPGREDEASHSVNNLLEPMIPLKVDVSTEWNQETMDAIDEWNRRSHNYAGNWSPKIIFCKNVSFIPNILNGRLDVNDSGIGSIEGRIVRFNDGTTQEFDTIVLCTGFRMDFARLGPDVQVKDNNVRNLYKHAFYPEHAGRLALIGFVRPFSGGIPICAEMQARYFALLCSNKLKLPANVDTEIRKDKAWEERSTALSPRHTEAIPAQSFFLDSIAKEIGCLVPMWKLILQPRLLVRHWFYPFNQACYRLTGPHSMRTRALKEMMSDKPGPMGSSIGILVFAASSMLPHFMHPKNMGGLLTPGEPSPPKARHQGRDHFLRLGSWKRSSGTDPVQTQAVRPQRTGETGM